GEETSKVEGEGAGKVRKMSTRHWDDGGVAHDARVVLAEGLLALDLIVGKRLELALVVFVRELLVLLDHR
nr:hypothetical protein [Tanacetum cinerariifolium]